MVKRDIAVTLVLMACLLGGCAHVSGTKARSVLDADVISSPSAYTNRTADDLAQQLNRRYEEGWSLLDSLVLPGRSNGDSEIILIFKK